jgi:hypothetical protein
LHNAIIVLPYSYHQSSVQCIRNFCSGHYSVWEFRLVHKSKTQSHSSEFTISNLREYNRSSPTRWILSHCWEHKIYFFSGLFGFLSAYIAFSTARMLFGEAAQLIIDSAGAAAVVGVSLAVLFTSVWDGLGSWIGSLSMVVLGN